MVRIRQKLVEGLRITVLVLGVSIRSKSPIRHYGLFLIFEWTALGCLKNPPRSSKVKENKTWDCRSFNAGQVNAIMWYYAELISLTCCLLTGLRCAGTAVCDLSGVKVGPRHWHLPRLLEFLCPNAVTALWELLTYSVGESKKKEKKKPKERRPV